MQTISLQRLPLKIPATKVWQGSGTAIWLVSLPISLLVLGLAGLLLCVSTALGGFDEPLRDGRISRIDAEALVFFSGLMFVPALNVLLLGRMVRATGRHLIEAIEVNGLKAPKADAIEFAKVGAILYAIRLKTGGPNHPRGPGSIWFLSAVSTAAGIVSLPAFLLADAGTLPVNPYLAVLIAIGLVVAVAAFIGWRIHEPEAPVTRAEATSPDMRADLPPEEKLALVKELMTRWFMNLPKDDGVPFGELTLEQGPTSVTVKDRWHGAGAERNINPLERRHTLAATDGLTLDGAPVDPAKPAYALHVELVALATDLAREIAERGGVRR